MANLFFFRLLLSSGLLLALASCGAEPAATRQPAASAARPAPAISDEQPLLSEAGAQATVEAIEQVILLPFGTPVPAENSQVVVQFDVDTGGNILHEKIVRGLSPVVDKAVLTALRTDHRIAHEYWPLPQDGKDVQVPCTLTIRAPGATTPAQRREATTRWQRAAQRLPGEADSTFVRRVLPLSAESYEPVRALAWRPSAFGKQLFFTQRGRASEDNEKGVDLFVLDPFRPNTYAVQVLQLENWGDLTTHLADLCLADLDHDGRPELLALARYSLREEPVVDGHVMAGHYDHFYTKVWHYTSPDPAGRPRYKADEIERPYLRELATPAAVRRALARHRRRQASRPLVPPPDSTARM